MTSSEKKWTLITQHLWSKGKGAIQVTDTSPGNDTTVEMGNTSEHKNEILTAKSKFDPTKKQFTVWQILKEMNAWSFVHWEDSP